MQETTADCSAVQVRASKRLHKLEHITTGYIKLCVFIGGGVYIGPKRLIKIGQNDPPQNQKRPSRNDPRPKRLTTETTSCGRIHSGFYDLKYCYPRDFIVWVRCTINRSHSTPCKKGGAQWLSGRVLDSRPKGSGFEPHRRHCVEVLEQDTFIPA